MLLLMPACKKKSESFHLQLGFTTLASNGYMELSSKGNKPHPVFCFAEIGRLCSLSSVFPLSIGPGTKAVREMNLACQFIGSQPIQSPEPSAPL